MQPEEVIGHVEAYDPEAQRAILRLDEGQLHAGDLLHFRGSERNFEEAAAPVNRRPSGEGPGRAEVRVRHPVEEGTPVRRVRFPYQDNQAELLDRFFDRVQGSGAGR